jgi:hypothetical protein
MSRVASMPNRSCSPPPREGSFWLDPTADADPGNRAGNPVARPLTEPAALPVVALPSDGGQTELVETPPDSRRRG